MAENVKNLAYYTYNWAIIANAALLVVSSTNMHPTPSHRPIYMQLGLLLDC